MGPPADQAAVEGITSIPGSRVRAGARRAASATGHFRQAGPRGSEGHKSLPVSTDADRTAELPPGS